MIAALAGADTVRGLGGNDVLCGGIGKDILIGGAGRDRLIGARGRDSCNGGKGRDTLKSCEAARRGVLAGLGLTSDRPTADNRASPGKRIGEKR